MESRSVKLSAILLLSLLLLGTLLIAACGDGGTTTTTAASGTTGSTGTSTALTPKYGGIMRIVTRSSGGNIGWPATQSAGGTLAQSYYETLLHSDNQGNLKPWLAESYKVADDQKSITLTIRKGVKFSDGSDLTAAVVKWNLDNYTKSYPKWASVEVVDVNTVRVNFKAWDSSLPGDFGDVGEPALYMVSKAAYDKNGETWITTHPVGTGPFILESYVVDSTAKLTKNPNYWAKDDKGGKLPYLDGLSFTFTSDDTTAMMMAKNNEVDMIVSVSPGKQMADYKNLGWHVDRSKESNEVWVPDSAHADSPWSKLEVREAAEYAIDRATIAKRFGYGYLDPVDQIQPRDTAAYDPNYANARNYDPAKAKQLLAQAGYPNGFKTKLIIWMGGNRDLALAEQQYLAQVGIQAELEFATIGQWVGYVGATGTYHNAILEGPCVAGGPTGLNTATFITGLYGNNMAKPAGFTEAVTAATSAVKEDVKLIRATTDLLAKSALVIPVWEIGGGRVQQSYVVADFGKRGLPAFVSLETAWLNK